MVKVGMSYFAGETSSFIPHGKREIEREKKKKENTILTIGQERLFQSETMEREKKEYRERGKKRRCEREREREKNRIDRKNSLFVQSGESNRRYK